MLKRGVALVLLTITRNILKHTTPMTFAESRSSPKSMQSRQRQC